MRLRHVAVLLALAGCGGPNCTLVGCESVLRVTLPPDTATATACIADRCTSVITAGALQLGLSRRDDVGTVRVTVRTTSTTGRAKSYAGNAAVVVKRPNGPDCAPVCVNAAVRADPASGRLVAA